MIVVARNARVEHWMWSASLVALPLFYAGFGVLAKDASAIELEMLYGIPFLFGSAKIEPIRSSQPAPRQSHRPGA